MSKINISENTPNHTLDFDRRNLLEATRLSRFPPVPSRFGAKSPPELCAACDRQIKNNSDVLADLTVCRACLRIYALVDDAINCRATRKRELVISRWSENLTHE